MAFGDNGPRKKSFFERLTVIGTFLIMLLVTVGVIDFPSQDRTVL